MKHLNKSQIMALIRQESRKRKESVDAAFTGMTTICLWIFHSQEHWSVNRMQTYLSRVTEYVDLIKIYGQEEIELLKERYNEEAFDKHQYRDEYVTIKKEKNPAWWFEAQRVITDNMITQKFDEYMLAHLNTMMDMNVNPKKIQTNRKKIVQFIDEELDKVSILDVRKKLFDETGIAVGMPGQSDQQILQEFGYTEDELETVTKY